MSTVDQYAIGVDIGGTFTDCVVTVGGRAVTSAKALTTVARPADGFFDAIEEAATKLGLKSEALFARTTRIAHATTVAINSLVTRTGPKVALVATAGHGDALRIMDNTGRIAGGTVEELLDYSRSGRPESFVASDLVFEIEERMDADGDVVVPLDESACERLASELASGGVEAVAVSFLWSHRNPAHELRAAQILRAGLPDAYVTVSHQVAPRVGEYPRTSATVMNAYVGPVIRSYTRAIDDGVRARGFRGEMLFGTAEAGLVHVDTIVDLPILTVQSGPAFGVLASAESGQLMGCGNVVVTDVGGTTSDASVIQDGDPLKSDESVVERHEVFLRKLDIESIGAGGGSVAWFDDERGVIRVGPQGAGSLPGPACYGRGGDQPSHTDADLALAYLDPDHSLANELKMDRGLAEKALAQLGERAGLDVISTAAAITQIVDNNIEDLLRRLVLGRGHDPRDFVVWACGGAAGTRAASFAANLGVSRVVIPMSDLASVWSAYGLCTASPAREFQTPLYLHNPFDAAQIRAAFGELEERARSFVDQFDRAGRKIEVTRIVDMKYALQWYSVEVPLIGGELDASIDLSADDLAHLDTADLEERFAVHYERRFGVGTGFRGAGTIIAAARLGVRVVPIEPDDGMTGSGILQEVSARRSRPMYWTNQKDYVDTPIFDESDVVPQSLLRGPCVVQLPSTTVLVPTGSSATVDDFTNIIIEKESE